MSKNRHSPQPHSSRDEKMLRKRLASIRQPAELQYGLFSTFCGLRNQDAFKLYIKGELAYRVGIIGVFLLNYKTCMTGSVVNSFFDTTAPSLEECLPLDEELDNYVSNVLNSNYNH